MLYLGTSPSEPDVAALLDSRRIGLMCQPRGNRHARTGWLWAADNGCFAETWREDLWLSWLTEPHPRTGCLFAVVPDVVADHFGTVERFGKYVETVMDARYPVAFVGQDGATIDSTPWAEFDAYFVGGTTEWKMGPAFEFAAEARQRGKWVHVGRVNSNARYQAWAPYADSCDGTFLAYGPKTNTPRLVEWLDELEREPSLWSTT